MHDGLDYGQPELITPQMEKNVGKARTLDPDQVRRFGFHGLSCEFLVSGRPRYAGLHGGYRRKHAAIRGHLRAHGVSWHSPIPPQQAKRRDHFPSRESGHRSRDDDQRRTDDRRQTGHLMRHQKGIIHEIH